LLLLELDQEGTVGFAERLRRAARVVQSIRPPAGRTSPLVIGACLGSMGLLIGLVETPGISGVIGCRPVGPIGLGQAAAAAALGTAAVEVVPALARRIAERVPPGLGEQLAGRTRVRASSESRTLRLLARSLPPSRVSGD